MDGASSLRERLKFMTTMLQYFANTKASNPNITTLDVPVQPKLIQQHGIHNTTIDNETDSSSQYNNSTAQLKKISFNFTRRTNSE